MIPEVWDGLLTALPVLLGVAWGLAGYLAAAVALGWVPSDRKPAAAMAWLLLMFVLPLIGILLFLLLGGRNLGKTRLLRQAESDERQF